MAVTQQLNTFLSISVACFYWNETVSPFWEKCCAHSYFTSVVGRFWSAFRVPSFDRPSVSFAAALRLKATALSPPASRACG